MKANLQALEHQLFVNGYADEKQMSELIELISQYLEATLKTTGNFNHSLRVDPVVLAHKVVEYEESAIGKIDAVAEMLQTSMWANLRQQSHYQKIQ